MSWHLVEQSCYTGEPANDQVPGSTTTDMLFLVMLYLAGYLQNMQIDKARDILHSDMHVA
jgi:hypothetical protein